LTEHNNRIASWPFTATPPEVEHLEILLVKHHRTSWLNGVSSFFNQEASRNLECKEQHPACLLLTSKLKSHGVTN